LRLLSVRMEEISTIESEMYVQESMKHSDNEKENLDPMQMRHARSAAMFTFNTVGKRKVGN